MTNILVNFYQHGLKIGRADARRTSALSPPYNEKRFHVPPRYWQTSNSKPEIWIPRTIRSVFVMSGQNDPGFQNRIH